MSKIGKNAFVVMAMCEKTKMPFGITVDPRQGKYVFTWSFKLKLEQAKHEGYDKTSVNGEVVYDNDYRGCPYCGSKSFYLCGKCGKIVCYHGQEMLLALIVEALVGYNLLRDLT